MSEGPAPYGRRQHVVAVIQARVGSTRLPHKVLRPVCGSHTMIDVIHNRLELCQEVSLVVAAIPDNPENDRLATILRRNRIAMVRGPEVDLVRRYRKVFDQTSAAAVVRITADCPLVDPDIVDHCVRTWRETPGLDYVSNVEPGPRTFPDGLDVEVLSREGFEKIDELSKHGDREPVTMWVWKHQERFRIAHYRSTPDLGYLRWTVDTQEDLDGARVVFSRMPEGFTMIDLMEEFGLFNLPALGKGQR